MDQKRINKLGKSLEDSFFQQRDQHLLEQLRQQMDEKGRLQELAAAAGISDEPTLRRLLETGIDGSALAALALYPLVAVAWADDSMAASEREAILQAASEDGLRVDSSSHTVLSQWLEEKPGPELVNAWKQYAHALGEELDDQQARALREHVIGRSRRVAEAAGGILGLGKISSEEAAVLTELEQALS